VKAVIALIAAVLLLATPGAHAATPSSGELNYGVQQVSWSGGPFYAPRPVACLDDTISCDRFYLRVALPPQTKIRVQLVADQPSQGGLAPLDGDDYDLYVMGPDNEVIAESAQPDQGTEALTFEQTAALQNYEYKIEIVPYLILPGSTYKASAFVLSG
jgi:hypothetical protein